MKTRGSPVKGQRSMLSTIGILAALGLAASASAAVTVTPTDIIVWGGAGGSGRSIPSVLGGTSWLNSGTESQPMIDSGGRVYFVWRYTPAVAVGTMAASQGPRAFFSGTTGPVGASPADLGVVGNNFFDGSNVGTNPGDIIVGGLSTTGIFNATGPGTATRVSGTTIMIPARVQGTQAANFTGTSQNNTMLFTGNNSGVSKILQRNDTITLNDLTATPTVLNTNTDMVSTVTAQFGGLNSSGATIAPLTVPFVAGQWISSNPATAPFGNNSALVYRDSAGVSTVVAQAGQSAPGGGLYRQGNNGVNGFTMRMNRNGQAYYDSTLVTTGLISATNNDVGFIYTPGTGSTRVYKEGQAGVDSTGAADAGGALYSGTPSNTAFSNAGAAIALGLTTGDVQTADANNNNSSGLYIATTTGTTRVFRRNDLAPGTVAADNVRMGVIASGKLMFNNSGRLAMSMSLQGSGVTTQVNPQFNVAGNPPSPVSVATAGMQGNESAIVTGNAGSLAIIARRGQLAPFTDGLRFDFSISTAADFTMNNNGDILFTTPTTRNLPGVAIGTSGGGPLSEILPAGPNMLYSYTTAYGLIPILVVGQQIEVESGVFKTLNTWNVDTTINGDGSTQGFNDSGVFAARVGFTDGTNGVLKLTIPAPASGAMAVLGLGVLARRRRK